VVDQTYESFKTLTIIIMTFKLISWNFLEILKDRYIDALQSDKEKSMHQNVMI